MKKTILLIVMLVALSNVTFSQSIAKDSTYKKFYIGSTFFMLGNLSSENSPDFVQLNFGYRLNPKNEVGIELKTWKYAWPLGIPYGDSYEAPEEEYPGYVRELGVTLVYKRYLWKGMYTSVDAMNTLQKYVDENGNKIQNGYQLFMTFRLGYHIELFKHKLFLEPSIACTYWPISTNTPESFQAKEDNWPNYFLFEPGLHFGFNF